MSFNYQDTQWVVQRNLTSKDDFERVKTACKRLTILFTSVEIIPFSDELPHFDKEKKSILYGSTTFNRIAYREPVLREGLFYDEATFSMQNYFEKWGSHMLNYGAKVCSFKELIETEMEAERLLFIRPDDDSKLFAGEVMQFDKIGQWYNKLASVANKGLSLENKIVVSEPYNIQSEWRLWIVNRKVVAASKYREYFHLRKEEGCLVEVLSFAESRIQEYTPHDVFVMDVGLSGNEYYIVECGCVNSAGFYKANVDDIVQAVTKYFVSHF